jgi:hypothetical protein
MAMKTTEIVVQKISKSIIKSWSPHFLFDNSLAAASHPALIALYRLFFMLILVPFRIDEYALKTTYIYLSLDNLGTAVSLSSTKIAALPAVPRWAGLSENSLNAV